MSQLPQGWIEKDLKDCVEILDSKRKPVNNKERQQRIEGKKQSDLYPYFGATGKVGYIDDYLFDEDYVALGEDGVPFFDPKKHKAYLLNGKTWVNNHAHVLNGIEVENRYLCHYLNQFDYHGYVNGATRLKLTQANMRKIPLRLAPKEDQKRIADKLDSVLAKVEAAQARLDKTPTILKRFRQSVLAAATSGELTKDWCEENGIDENWKVCKLKELSNSIRSGSGKKPSDVENGTPILRSSAVRILDIDYSDFRTIEESLLTERDFIQGGDLLFTRLSGSKEYVGNCAKVGNLSRKMAYPDRLFKVELNDIELADYIEVYCSSPSYFKYIEESIKSSAGHQRITTEVIKGIEIKLPSKTERDEILRTINLLFAKASKVERQYLNAKSKIDSLTQSILLKAFSGKL